MRFADSPPYSIATDDRLNRRPLHKRAHCIHSDCATLEETVHDLSMDSEESINAFQSLRSVSISQVRHRMSEPVTGRGESHYYVRRGMISDRIFLLGSCRFQSTIMSVIVSVQFDKVSIS